MFLELCEGPPALLGGTTRPLIEGDSVVPFSSGDLSPSLVYHQVILVQAWCNQAILVQALVFSLCAVHSFPYRNCVFNHPTVAY